MKEISIHVHSHTYASRRRTTPCSICLANSGARANQNKRRVAAERDFWLIDEAFAFSFPLSRYSRITTKLCCEKRHYRNEIWYLLKKPKPTLSWTKWRNYCKYCIYFIKNRSNRETFNRNSERLDIKYLVCQIVVVLMVVQNDCIVCLTLNKSSWQLILLKSKYPRFTQAPNYINLQIFRDQSKSASNFLVDLLSSPSILPPTQCSIFLYD